MSISDYGAAHDWRKKQEKNKLSINNDGGTRGPHRDGQGIIRNKNSGFSRLANAVTKPLATFTKITFFFIMESLFLFMRWRVSSVRGV